MKRKVFEAELKSLYLDRCLTDREIADKLGCTKQAVYTARKKFGINKLSVLERNSRLIKITSTQEQILRGSLLGDAYLGPEGVFDIQHGKKQFDYLLWLYRNLQPYFGEIRNTRACRRIRSCSHRLGTDLRQEYYVGNRKVVTRNILDKLTPLSLAVWFMDDGQVLPSGKQARIATYSFSAEENELICKYFSEVWEIDTKVSIYKGKDSEYPYVFFNKENTDKLISLISVHIPMCMRYKIRYGHNLSLYLSGGMEFKKDLGAPWREWLSGELEKINYSSVDPVKLEAPKKGLPLQCELTKMKMEGELDKVRTTVRETLFRKDMFGIQLSDGIIVLYDESSRRGAGTLSEAWESFREGRPVYVVTEFPPEDIPAWLIGETTEIFGSFEELLMYLKDHDTVIQDIENAQKARDAVLYGIY
jgi:hypothetical protein